MNAADLGNLAVFAGLSGDDIARVAEAATERSYPVGRDVVVMGEITDGFFVILVGTARVVGRGDTPLATLGEGDFFGEVGALDAGPGYASARTATVTAETDLTVALLPGERFTELVASIPGFREHILTVMRDRDEERSANR